MRMMPPQSVLEQIQKLHGPSLDDWWSFRYLPIPNSYSVLMLAMIANFMLFDFWIYGGDDLIGELLDSVTLLLWIDGILYWWYTQSRCMLAVRRYQDGGDWRNIRQEDVLMS